MTWPPPRGSPVFGFLLCGLAAALLFGCGETTPLEVKFAGCTAMLVPGPICVLNAERELTLWVPKPPETEIEIRAGRRLPTLKGEESGAGIRYEVKVPPQVDLIRVIRKGPGRSRAIWSLEISPLLNVQFEISQGLRAVHQLNENLRLAEARARFDALEKIAESNQLSSRSLYQLAYYRGLLAEKEGDFRTALEELEKAAQIARDTNLAADLPDALQARALRLSDLGRSREAAGIYARLARDLHTYEPCDEVDLLSNWAWATLLAREAGGELSDPDLEEPVPLLEKALAKLLSHSECPADQVFNLRLNLVLAYLQESTRTEQARQANHWQDRAYQELGEARSLAAKGTLFQNLWYLDLQGRLDLARRQPQRALEVYERLDRVAGAIGSADGRLRAILGRARANAALERRDEALALLAAAEKLLDGVSLRIPLHEGRETFVSQREGVASLEVELLLDAGRERDAFEAARRARSRFLRQLATAERLASLESNARDAWNDAIRRYQEERQKVDTAASEAWRLLAGQVGPAGAALEAEARKAERQLDRAFTILDGPPAPGALPPPRPGELVLVFHPLPKGWVALTSDDRNDIAVKRFALSRDLLKDEARLAQAVLKPFEDRIRSVRRIRILPYGALRDVDFHALPFDKGVLLDALPVSYGLDLPVPARVKSKPAQDQGLEALLVADPNDNLRGAVVEANAVFDEIKAWTPPWRIHRLTASDATRDAIRQRLGKVDLLHFAGHGSFDGFGGWDSSLELAKSRLTVGDLLVLRAPRWAVLSGCETARATEEARIEGFGLANALVVAGAHGVVASVRPVFDSTASPLFIHLYHDWQGGEDLAGALRRAQLAWHRDHPDVDWASFRLIEP